jgi:hypothetical protein
MVASLSICFYLFEKSQPPLIGLAIGKQITIVEFRPASTPGQVVFAFQKWIVRLSVLSGQSVELVDLKLQRDVSVSNWYHVWRVLAATTQQCNRQQKCESMNHVLHEYARGVDASVLSHLAGKN